MTDLDEQLHRAVRRAYDVFPEFDFGERRATVCHCPSCVSKQTALALARMARAEIGVEWIREYLGSAHSHEGTADRELRHFLPRIFELLAAGEQVSYISNEVGLQRLGPECSDYRRNGTHQEIEAIDAFFEAYWLSILNEPPSLYQRPGTGEWLFDDAAAEESLCMIAIAGGEIEPLLALWDAQSSLTADLQLAALVENATGPRRSGFSSPLDDGHLGSPYWGSTPDAERRTAGWLLDVGQYGRLIEASWATPPDSPEARVLAEVAEQLQRTLVRRRAGL